MFSLVSKLMKVAAGTLPEAFDDRVKQLGADHPDVKALPTTSTSHELACVLVGLKSLASSTATWPYPLPFKDKRSEYHALYTRMHTAKQSVTRFFIVFDGIKHSKELVVATEMEDVRNLRDKISKWMRTYGCVPAALAKAAADWLSFPSAKANPLALACVQGDALSKPETWREPVFVQWRLAEHAECTYLHNNFRDFMTTTADAIVAKAEEKIPVMLERKPPNRHYFCVMPGVGDLKLNGPDCKPFMDAERSVVLHISKVLDVDRRLVAFPWNTMGIAVQMVRGAALVVLVEPAQCVEVADPQLFVAQAHHTVFAKNRCLMLREGDGLIMPVATVPIVIGLPFDNDGIPLLPTLDSKDGKVEEQHILYSVQPLFDSALDLQHTHQATAFAVGQFVAASQYLPVSLRNRGSAWKDALSSRPPELES